ncbi:MAG: tyrosine-type recombinase/integrase [Victivallales bacterium]|nr:tyrosine-type recombinase/integrase [Victivallales bacterium]
MNSMMMKVCQYIDYRRSLGNKLATESNVLKSFARYADTYAPDEPVSTKLVLAWIETSKAKRMCKAKRMDALRPFTRYLFAEDTHTEILPTHLLGRSFERTTPYIYTKEDIRALMHAADIVGRDYRLNHETYKTLIGLLACTGLRIHEALALNCSDVDLNENIITVRESKNLPMRLVPFEASTSIALLAYSRLRDDRHRMGIPFFRGPWGGRLRYDTFTKVFRVIRKKANITDGKGMATPTIYHLRHTFACNCLLNCYRANKDIDKSIHALSVYLGHSNLASTYWYLTGIPELMTLSAARFKRCEGYCK